MRLRIEQEFTARESAFNYKIFAQGHSPREGQLVLTSLLPA